MKKLLNNKDQQSKAEVVDQHLILSLLDAKDPKVWRMALDKIGTASFEIKKEKDSEATKLVLRPKKGTAEIIATYNTQQQALQALTNASEALQTKNNTYKTKTPTTAQTNPHETKEKNKWIIAILGALIVIGLYMYLTTLIPEKTVGFEATSTNTSTNTNSPQEKTGVPVSADDFLSGQ